MSNHVQTVDEVGTYDFIRAQTYLTMEELLHHLGSELLGGD